ncbi:MAG: hypothetical protein AAF623_14630, partial [Planctomycetota bacterium]
MKFSLGTLLLILTVFALAVCLFVTRAELAKKTAQLDSFRNELRYLTIDDETKINVISIPAVGRKSWRWRIFLPQDHRFTLKVGFDDVPFNGLPLPAQRITRCELPSGESILTASLNKENGEWGLSLHSESNGTQNFSYVQEITAENTEWLDKRGGCSVQIAGDSQTDAGDRELP